MIIQHIYTSYHHDDKYSTYYIWVVKQSSLLMSCALGVHIDQADLTITTQTTVMCAKITKQ